MGQIWALEWIRKLYAVVKLCGYIMGQLGQDTFMDTEEPRSLMFNMYHVMDNKLMTSTFLFIEKVTLTFRTPAFSNANSIKIFRPYAINV